MRSVAKLFLVTIIARFNVLSVGKEKFKTMKKEITGRGIITENNEFKIYESEYFKGQVINNFKGKKIKIIVELEEKYVSNPQLAYYFGVLLKTIVGHYLENGVKTSKGEIDELLRYNFLFKEVTDLITGEIRRIPHALNNRETEVTTKMMITFFEDCMQWASQELCLYICEPNEETKQYGLEEPNN